MFHYATKVEFLDDVKLKLTYQDGKVVLYDLSKMFSKYPKLKELRDNRDLFLSGHLDPGGYGVIWNDELDFDASSIYECGEVIGQVDISLNSKIGLLIQKVREEKGITQVELSKLSHIDQGDISKLEKGIGNPTLAKIDKIFKALEVNLDFLIK